MKKHFKKYLFITDCKIYNKSLYINYLVKINQKYIYLCDKYKIFDNIKNFVQKKYIESSYIKKFYYYQDDNLNNIEIYTQSTIQTFDI